MNKTDQIYDFLEKHWRGLLVALATFIFSISILGRATILTIFLWGLVLIASLITFNDAWGVFFKKVQLLGWKILSFWAKIASGGYGIRIAVIVNGATLLILAIYMMMPFIGAVGTLMVIGAIISIPYKKING